MRRFLNELSPADRRIVAVLAPFVMVGGFVVGFTSTFAALLFF